MEDRSVGVCVLGLDHDAVEEEVTRLLRKSKCAGEAIFFEVDDRFGDDDPCILDRHHWGLDDHFFAMMSGCYMMMVVQQLSLVDERVLGFGLFRKSMRDQFRRRQRIGGKIYESYARQFQILVGLSIGFFEWVHRFSTKFGWPYMRSRALTYFNNEAVTTIFITNLQTCLSGIAFSGNLIVLKQDTLSFFTYFLNDFYDLLTTYREDLPASLGEIIQLYSDLVDFPCDSDKYVSKIKEAIVEYRDRVNWDYVHSFVTRCSNVKRIILVVGTLHVPSLSMKIMRQNAIHASSESVWYRNVVAVTNTERYGKQDELQIQVIMDKIDHWRML